jgi:archaellum component FlaC
MEPELEEMLKDLLWLNSVIATELIQITENTSQILRKEDIPESCRVEHAELRRRALEIAEKCHQCEALKNHLEKHQ